MRLHVNFGKDTPALRGVVENIDSTSFHCLLRWTRSSTRLTLLRAQAKQEAEKAKLLTDEIEEDADVRGRKPALKFESA